MKGSAPLGSGATDRNALVARIEALAAAHNRVLLGITGSPGAGKSTLAVELAEALGTQGVPVAWVPMDGFHLADAELTRLGRRDRKGAPDTFDCHGYAALLDRLRRNAEPVVYAPLFDRGLEEPIGSAVPVRREVPLVLTEGNYLLHDVDAWPAARACLDAVWFLDVPDDLRTRRLVARHEHYGMATDAALARATTGPDGANARLVAGTRDRADLVLRLTD
jgi:pantothenate kinase